MNALGLLVKKNLTLLLRAKASALVVILAPLLIILVLGVSYNTNSPYGLNIGVVGSTSADVQAFTSALQQEGFKVITYAPEQGKDCLQDIGLGFVHTCIQVPDSFAVEGNTPKEVTFQVDPSRVQLVWMIQETLQSKFNLKAREISQQLSQELVGTLSSTKVTISEKKGQTQGARDLAASASSSLDAAKGSLVTLDLAVLPASYNTTIMDNLSSEADAAVSKNTLAKSKIEATNLSSSQKLEITSLLAETDDLVQGVAAALKSGGSLRGLVESLQADLSAAQSKLSSAAESVTSSQGQLETSASALQETVSTLDHVVSGLGEAQSKLESQQVTDPGTIATPLVTKVQRVGKEGTYLNYVFPALLMLVVMFTSLLLGTTLVMMEKSSPAYVRNFFLPLRKITFVTATFLTNGAVLMIQLVIILGVSLFFLKDLLPHLPLLFLVALLASMVFTLLGMAIGYLFTSEETGILASISTGSILLFLSGVILPLESLPAWLREIVAFNPYVIAEKILREVLIFKAEFLSWGADLAMLVVYAGVLFLLILVGDAYLHYRYTHNSLRHRHKLLREETKQQKNTV